VAAKQGLIVLTDSDGAGFVIRNYIKGSIPPAQVKHAYIPDIYGKERRKRAPGKEGKLGVEGMRPEVLLQSLLRAGATVEGENSVSPRGELNAADLFVLGLTGREDSAARRSALLRRLELPEHMSAKALLTVLNALYTSEELNAVLAQL
jgi:ribonuclease M5